MTAMVVGAALALLAVGYVLYPLMVGTKPGGSGQLARACSKCGALAVPEAKFCPGCGSPLD